MRPASRSSLRLRLVAAGEQHSGTIALASQNATSSAILAFPADRGGCGAARHRGAARRVRQNAAGRGCWAFRIGSAMFALRISVHGHYSHLRGSLDRVISRRIASGGNIAVAGAHARAQYAL
jgi:hypothetical protein